MDVVTHATIRLIAAGYIVYFFAAQILGGFFRSGRRTIEQTSGGE